MGRIIVLFFWIGVQLPTDAFAHGEGHQKKMHTKNLPESSGSEQRVLLRIRDAYLKGASAIFERKCFDCHGNNTRYPWYYAFPGARQLIVNDITEAKKHLDMSNGFPFSGHGNAKEDLQAIRDDIENGVMPPFRYRLLHSDNTVSEDEKKIISEWLNYGDEILRQ
jgi:hypothetical protein